MSEEEQKQQLHEKIVKIDWRIPENLVSQYANNVFVQQGPYEFVISFFETRQPLLLGTPEENSANLMRIESMLSPIVKTKIDQL